LGVNRGKEIGLELSVENSASGIRSRHDPWINDRRGSSTKSTAVTENPSSTKYLIAGESPHKGTNARRRAREGVVSDEEHDDKAGLVEIARGDWYSTGDFD
jgi:hypothetical protein